MKEKSLSKSFEAFSQETAFVKQNKLKISTSFL